ncbi:hypothetical protein BBO99_00002720 [Phytophthora kernoviae]|uniref:Glycoside hydrolase family 5 domain-containing protein n=2 Tax=Phytophthora kernoviae TaxID=325452 RepID=A0A3R7K1L9_9STRA|nr:hypothetical protein BBI17_009175 [Phytophthora kernoviae]RLN82671.1 hypothetical protein BBO99_00002720 [Phytophthora kernoviae]
MAEISRPMPASSSGAPATYRNSEFSRPSNVEASYRQTESGGQREGSMYGYGPGGQRQTEMKLLAVEPELGLPPERTQDYKGRIRTWPGLLFLLVIVAGAIALITINAMDVSDQMNINAERYENASQTRRKIKDGLTDNQVIISDDGQVGNPKKYPDMGCELPDYQSKNGQIFAVAKNGTEVPVGIKGLNWFGMETGLAIPFGLWENMENGTSVYEVAGFLSRNNFNSVRLPVCIKSILKNTAPDKTLINANTNRAINITSYVTTIQTIVEALGYRHISVMISLHTLDPKKSGGAWYSDDLGVSEDDFLDAVDILTKNLCGPKYWNIIGLDLKNEPHECSWGGDDPDWQKGATLIGNRMLEGCPSWLAFVEGIASKGTITLNGEENTYFDWWGGGLADAGGDPITFDVENKLVWAPHYYNTGVNPAWYLYGGGTQNAEGALEDYVELDDETLKNNVEKTMDKMFGYLLADTPHAMVMGEFAGLYGKDKHPLLTTKRTTDFTIEVMLKASYAGGYMWSLNPESAYQFNPADTYGTFTEGLLEDDWLTPNKAFVEGMAPLDKIKDLKMFPCFPVEVASGAGSYRESTNMSQRQTEMKLMAMEPSDTMPPEQTRDYKGRIRTWKGLVLLCLIVGGAAAIITACAISANDKAAINQARYENKSEARRRIKDGLDDDQVIISDDGQVGNPKKYPDMGCELPDYQSKDGQIFAVSKNGTEVPVGIKGVNWFGMETGLAIPFGLWENMDNGTSVYEIAAFLARNKYNSVRLPVCIKNILKNTAPSKDLINVNTNRAINITSYMTTIQTIVEALGYRRITVMISLHTLDTKTSGGAWYSDELDVTEDQFLEAVDMLTKNLCGSKYWNILGLDLKNEPYQCSWGGSAPDWQKGATLIGNRMLEGCPNWMAFVEGIASSGTITLGSRTSTYFDWWGGGLTKAGANPIEYDIENKLVWAPHYYNTGVYPAWYMYASGSVTASGAIENYVELDDETLRNNVEKTMDAMFGYLRETSPYAMVMGEFAGLYAKDKHPMLTTQRSTDYTIEVMVKAGYAGGYMWSLNPESAYQYNPADTFGEFTEGLLEDDWLTPNKVFMQGMDAMDEIKDLKMFPCFPQKVSS